MSDRIYDATKKYCGAIAVSWYEPYEDAVEVIDQCHARGIKVNIHYLLHRESVRAAIRLLREERRLLQKVNAIVFLNYKPIHSTQRLCLQDNEDMADFLNTVREYRDCKLGFDSCMISYLTSIEEDISHETVDFCEAGRFSAFISEKGMLYPCSFMNDIDSMGINLAKVTLEQGWQQGANFQQIRKRLSTPGMQRYPIESCGLCRQYEMCHGGCPMFPINRCREG
jgi:radical SAM protein with 4Fe4S-binding SPASM domain